MAYLTKSLDGTDTNNVRAEVRIEIGEGIVTSIDKKTSSAQVKFSVDGFKQPVGAWVAINSPAFAEAQKSFDEKKVVSYRIEQQRKPGIDRTIPIDELRKDMKEAADNTTRIFASINDAESGEGVTNPEEDPAYGGRLKATSKDIAGASNAETSPSAPVDAESILASLTRLTELNPAREIVTAAAGAAIVAGVDAEKVFTAVSVVPSHANAAVQPERRNSFSTEAASWKEYNTDGSLNLGHMRFSSGVSSESFVRIRLYQHGLREEELNEGVAYFTRLILSITDRVQIKAYGEGYRPDRGSQSHARIRGIVYDTIDNYTPIPYPASSAEPKKEIQQWVGQVGRLAYERFIIALESTEAAGTFTAPLPAGLYPHSGETETAATTNNTAATETGVTTTAAAVEKPAAKAAPAKKQNTATPELVTEPEPTPAAPAAEVNADEERFEKAEKYPKTNISTLEPEKLIPKATKETQEEFTELVKETGIAKEEYSKVADVLVYTFGNKYNRIASLPEPVLADFIDFYISNGVENFRDVIQTVPKQAE